MFFSYVCNTNLKTQILMKKILLIFAILLSVLGFSQVYFSDNFDDQDITDWTIYDVDADTYTWETVALGSPNTPAIASYSYDNATGTALTPDNYIVSPAINLSTATSAILKFKVKAQDPAWPNETYAVYAATTNSVSAFLANPPLLTENAASNGTGGVFYGKTVDLSAFAGQAQVYIAFRHYNSNDNFSIHIDDVSVEAAPATAPNCATLNTPANSATNVSYFSVSLNWAAPSSGSAPDSYDVYLDQNANPTTLLGNVSTGTTYTVSNLLPSTTYYWKVIAKNSVGSATGCTIYSFTTMPPTYCAAGANSTSFEKISNVTVADINNSSTATAGYEDFTAVTGNLNVGQAYTFTATFTGTSYSSDQVLVWVDLNQDKDFDDAGELLLTTALGKSPWTGSITIPATATLGNTRMRVRLHDSSLGPNATPCGNSSYGQVEDYTVNLSTLAVSDVTKNNVKVYPIPVTDVLNIESPNKVKTLVMYDASGKVVYAENLNSSKSQVNVSKLSPGSYIAKITTDSGVQTIKVMKK